MMMKDKVVDLCVNRPKTVIWATVGISLAIIALVLMGTLTPLPLNPVEVDTDPENMLSHDEPVRVFHNAMRKKFDLHDIAVVGVANEEHPDGVFNPETLKNIYDLTEFAKTLQWEDEEGKLVGVIEVDLIAASTVDNIEQAGLGVVNFEWLMAEPPKTAEEARAIGDKAARIPFLNGTLVSENRKSLALYLPLTSKDVSNEVYNRLNEKIAEIKGDESYHLTGLPMAEDVFGVEMFVQMGISGPLSMVMIFVLLLIFFRKINLILAPMIISQVTVVVAMGGMIICGFSIHILSSLIPIFIMPIAVLDAVHILSEFFDRYQQTRDREKTIKVVMDELFTPMLYTSLTTAAGFVSLAFTPIPPVRIFGTFVAIGIMAAWLLTITFMPAYIMLIRPEKLETFGAKHEEGDEDHLSPPTSGILARVLYWMGGLTYRQAKPILGLSLVVLAIAVYGISQIVVNDNPMKWFGVNHPIRVADRIMNRNFGGTYMAYLALSAPDEQYDPARVLADFNNDAKKKGEELKNTYGNAPEAFAELQGMAEPLVKTADSRLAFLELLAKQLDSAAREGELWEQVSLFVDSQRQKGQIFKDPKILAYIEQLQEVMGATEVVGKSTSVVDLIKTIHRELLLGDDKQYRIPDNREKVAQCMLTFQTGHRPQDLWHYVTPDYRSTSLWVQLKSGDNTDMTHVVDAVNAFIEKNPLPAGLTTDWFGLTYLNVVWQDKMVYGMLEAFAGSFFVVFFLMSWMFRSALWGFLSMLPLTLTITTIYGVVGLVGKSYDMPVAVLSSLSLGLAVDFAIHFLVRGRTFRIRHGSWELANRGVFGEPARAITRNIIVVATGFTPLLFAPLTPYQTVGTLLATILLLSGLVTLLVLPALVRLLERPLFASAKTGQNTGSNTWLCIGSGISIGGITAISVKQYSELAPSHIIGIGVAGAVVMSVVFYVVWRIRSPQSF
ncbi:MAG: MMPL family transporter [Proteobacteria bacterium]|nr:MMPL family transporter [Pseudomonadota bacterium]